MIWSDCKFLSLKIARKNFQITALCKKVCTCSILKESKIKLAADNMNKAYIKRQVPTKYMLHNSLDNKMPLPTLTLPHCIILSVNKRDTHQIWSIDLSIRSTDTAADCTTKKDRIMLGKSGTQSLYMWQKPYNC